MKHRVDEREMHAFLPTSGGEQVEQPLFLELRGGQCPDRLRSASIDHRDRLEPHEPGNLFDEIALDGDVEPVGGRLERERFADRSGRVRRRAVDLPDTDPREQIDDPIGRHLEPQHATDLRRSQRDAGRATHCRSAIFGGHLCDLDSADDPARHLEHEPGGTLDRPATEFRIHAALEALTGIGRQPVTTATSRDGGGREPGDFEHHAGRLGRHAGAYAAHHTGHRDRPCGVGDDKHIRREFYGTTIEQIAGLPAARETHIEPALDLVEIVGMHRLAELEDDVVGDVDDRADAALPGAPQTLAQPEW